MPQEWYSRAPGRFKHVKEMNLHSNTLEFLDETQKYIHLIRHPIQIEEHYASSPELRCVSPTRSIKSNIVKAASVPLIPLESAPEIYKHEEFKGAKVTNRKITSCSSTSFKSHRAASPRSSSPKTHLKTVSTMISSPKTNPSPIRRRIQKSKTEVKLPGESYLVTAYAIPRAFTSVKRVRRPPMQVRNSKIQSFLDRFDSSPFEEFSNRPINPKSQKAVSLQQKLAFATLRRKRQIMKDYIGPSLTTSMNARQIGQIKVRPVPGNSYIESSTMTMNMTNYSNI